MIRIDAARRIAAALLLAPAAGAFGQFSSFDFAEPELLEFPNAQGPTMAAVADLDSDGDPDLVVPGRNVDFLFYVALNDGAGQFSLHAIQLEEQSQWCDIADLNGDGALDVLVLMRGRLNPSLMLLPGAGDGTFGEPTPLVTLRQREGVAVALSDVDDDGDLDAMVTTNNPGGYAAVINDTPPDAPAGTTPVFTLGAATLLDETATGFTIPSLIVAADLTGDGRDDYAVSQVAPFRVARFDAPADPGPFARETMYEPIFGAPGINTGDPDGDGDVDLLVASGTSSQLAYVTIMQNDGVGGFDSGQAIQATNLGGVGWHMASGDLDGDGDEDLVQGAVLNGYVTFIEQIEPTPEGELQFLLPQQLLLGFFHRFMITLDIDGDADLDVLAIDIGDNSIRIFRNETPQGPRPPVPPAAAAPARAPGPPVVPDALRSAAARVLQDWGPTPGGVIRATDLTRDGRVDARDLDALLRGAVPAAPAAAGEEPPPEACGPDAGDCLDPKGNGTPGCDDVDCCAIVCAADPFCCDTEWDITCAEQAAVLCTPPPACPAEGDCFTPHESPGCDDPVCCELICTIDPWCCGEDLVWDALCAEQALQLCPVAAQTVECPAGGETEIELCAENLNNGCNLDEPVFTPAACGDIWCAELNTAPRDSDWYELTVGAGDGFVWRVDAEFPAQAFILTGDCKAGYRIVASVYGDASGPIEVELADPVAGVYWCYVGPGTPTRKYVSGAPCDPDPKDPPKNPPAIAYTRAYVAAIECAVTPCPADLTGDDVVGPPDLAVLLAAWNTADAAADLNDDGVVNAADLAILLAGWGPCD